MNGIIQLKTDLIFVMVSWGEQRTKEGRLYAIYIKVAKAGKNLACLLWLIIEKYVVLFLFHIVQK